MTLSTGWVHIGQEARAQLMNWMRSSSVRPPDIMLAAADGEGPSAVSRRLGVGRGRLQDPRPVARSVAQRPNLGLSAGQARTVVMDVHSYA
jgi:hypothetical protein